MIKTHLKLQLVNSLFLIIYLSNIFRYFKLEILQLRLKDKIFNFLYFYAFHYNK